MVVEHVPNPALIKVLSTLKLRTGIDDAHDLVDDLEEIFPPSVRRIYPITGMGKPRQTQRDKWNPSPAVQKYRLFADTVRLYKIDIPDHGYKLTFVMPMPPSWSKKKRAAMDGQPHQQKPDKDNLEKALIDAARKGGNVPDDKTIWNGEVTKIWGETGSVIIETEVHPDGSKQEPID